MKKILSVLLWTALSILGAGSVAIMAFSQGEKINALWFITATVCVFMVSYRFHSKWLAAKVLTLDDTRATPAYTHEDGKDYVPTNKWIVFGHHFAAIAGAGPLAGPVLAAQFGYLPGMLWLLIGSVLGGAVHDAVTMFCSIRRGGKSLGQMVKDEVGTPAGIIALVSIVCIMVILIAVLSLIVVKALAESPWGLFTIAMTIPIALFMGCYLRFLRPRKVFEVSAIGVALLLLVIWGGKYVSLSEFWSGIFTRSEPFIAWSLILYGLAASILPVWLLLAPRDYLSSFMKIGTIIGLMVAIIWVAPQIRMPKLTPFIFGNGLVVSGMGFPFIFITVACGAISGFHALISSGTTPKMVMRENTVRTIGYGAMITEMAVGVMALIAATILEPGQYFAINTKAEVAAIVLQDKTPAEIVKLKTAAVVNKVSKTGFAVTTDEMDQMAKDIGEKTMCSRTGGAPTFAVGMAEMFAKAFGGKALMPLFYHFAIMFEALFILTTIDAGTRVGRFILQDLLGHVWKPIGDTSSNFSIISTSVLFVAGWGWFLYQGVIDPLGGVNTLWPIFGVANQLLAVIALSLGTTVLIKMGRVKYAWVTLLPMLFLLVVTITAGIEKIYAKDAAGFLPAIAGLRAQLVTASPEAVKNIRTLIFNNQVDITVTAFFMFLVLLIVAANVHLWWCLLTGRKEPKLREDPRVELASIHPGQ
ncbi:MAG: carbon starvation CstA family protein [Kiritimatiellae bacterium]|nr:carbon starvation CstA family protein [Kiritimatiellia bacterium]MDD5521134.1 carbon starvation CstA family protein [Kiritimatiellia bacterium]